MSDSNLKIIFGGAVFTDSPLPDKFGTPERVEKMLEVLEIEGIKNIDSANIYGTSEELLGKTNAASRFIIDTKHPGGWMQGLSNKETVIALGEGSLQTLNADSLDIYYLHAPDRVNSLEPILAGINALHESGKFKRFGLSNFQADEIEEVVRITKGKGWVVPSVFQGNYSAIARLAESEIFPTIRRHNMAFYAYSPIAGGFLTKTPEELAKGGSGRWDPSSAMGQIYGALYKKPALLKALETWGQISGALGITKAELAYRWVAFHSLLDGNHGDGIVIGATKIEQVTQTVASLRKGPLDDGVAARIDDLWKMVEHEAPVDNFSNTIGFQKESK